MSKDVTLLEEISEQDLTQINGGKKVGCGNFCSFTLDCQCSWIGFDKQNKDTSGLSQGNSS